MPIIIGGVFLVVYYFLCRGVASKAASQGRSYGFWFVAAVVLDPFLPFLALMLLEN